MLIVLIDPGRGRSGVGVKVRENEVEEVEPQKAQRPETIQMWNSRHTHTTLELTFVINDRHIYIPLFRDAFF